MVGLEVGLGNSGFDVYWAGWVDCTLLGALEFVILELKVLLFTGCEDGRADSARCGETRALDRRAQSAQCTA